SGNGETHPRHLLHRLLRCECGAFLGVGGAGASYMTCPKYPGGPCDCRTQVQRERAERMILGAIGERILSQPPWHEAVFKQTLAAWKQQAAQQPEELQSLESSIAEIERKIDRLIDGI